MEVNWESCWFGWGSDLILSWLLCELEDGDLESEGEQRPLYNVELRSQTHCSMCIPEPSPVRAKRFYIKRSVFHCFAMLTATRQPTGDASDQSHHPFLSIAKDSISKDECLIALPRPRQATGDGISQSNHPFPSTPKESYIKGPAFHCLTMLTVSH